MKKNYKITPEGTRDYLFEECTAHRGTQHLLEEVFVARGFRQVVTPGLEFYDVFDPEWCGISTETMYKLTDRRGRLLVLRPDSTLPIARLTATRLQGQEKPLRLFYTQQVYRSNPGLMGRADEILQSGIELLGIGGKRADLEALVTAIQSISTCVSDFRLELGHAGLFRGLVEKLDLPEELREDIRGYIEMKNYPALDAVLEELGDSKEVNALRQLPRLFGGEEVFQKAQELGLQESAGDSLQYLQELYHALSELNLSDRIIVDLGLVQRIDYYTGIVFSAYLSQAGDAVLSGGRYDHLLERYGVPMPAIGFAVNVDALTRAMTEQGCTMVAEQQRMLVHGDEGFEIKALNYASRLTQRGIACEFSVFDTRQQAIEYAQRVGITQVDFVADETESMQLEQGVGQ